MASGQITAWHAEHLNFARLLRLLEAQVALFAQGCEPDYGLIADIVNYLHDFPDVHHHRYENEVFSLMGKRDPQLKPLVARLLQEHRVIAACGAALTARLDAVVAGAVVERAQVEAAAATFVGYYRAHLDTEESIMLPRAAAMLDAQDWVEVARVIAGRAHHDPLFGPQAELRFRELRQRIEREAVGAPGSH